MGWGAVVAVVVATVCVHGAAADILPPPSRPEAETSDCHASKVARDGESCFDCRTTYDAEDDCALESLALGRERRCIVRNRTTIDEVWCAVPGAPGASPS